MSLLSISEAAKFVDKSVQTLNRHVKAGKLSKNADGLFDSEELIKVYGLKQAEIQKTEAPSQTSDTGILALRQKINNLENEILVLQQRLAKSEKHINSLEQQLTNRAGADTEQAAQLVSKKIETIFFKADETEYKSIALTIQS